jgi:hypothetical protein
VSIKVRQLLELLGIETTHEERLEIDRIIEERTGLYCDEGVDLLTKEEFLEIVYEAKRRLKKRKETEKKFVIYLNRIKLLLFHLSNLAIIVFHWS